MDNFRLSLDILFRKLNPEDIIKSSFKAENRNSYGSNNINKDSFINLGINEATHYSNDEMNNIYYLLQDWMKDRRLLDNSKSNSKSIFNLFISFGEDVLIDNNGVPECKYEQMMRWRMIFHKLGQDIFTTAYFAYKDAVSSYDRNFFAWNPYVNSNNVRLHNILGEGLSENHFHLKGSAPVFSLTWTSLMNRISNREGEFYKSGMMNNRLEPDIEYNDNTERTNFPSLCKKAAIIRAFLFCKLNNMLFFDVKGDPDHNEYDNTAKRRDKEELKKALKNSDPLMAVIDTHTIQGIIDSLKYNFGKRFEDVSTGKNAAIDYTTPKNAILRGKDYNQYYVGERMFLYSIFKKIYKNDPEFIEYQNLFYSYLVIKSKLRGELIQINDRVGFDNFSAYQDRKNKFLDKDPLLKKAIYYTAIRTTMENQNIVSLEARITPENSAGELSKEIYKMDKIINYNKEKQEKYFYVVHFIKGKDNDISLQNSLFISTRPRHSKKRLEIKKQALAILKLRNSLEASAGRILGIDACSNEIGCRPEVFAQVFRYLRTNNFHTENEHLFEIQHSMQLRDNYDTGKKFLERSNYYPMENEHLFNNRYPIKLRATYHVGEDFLDIIDGLRAIDETVYFLNFSHGDRLGHALALGVDVEQWYNKKNKRLIMPKQDFLDNIVWMLIKIKEFNVIDMKNLINDLAERFDYLFNDIYSSNFKGQQKGKNFSVRQYYDAWKLRGDDPEKYIDCDYTKKFEIHYWDRCAINYYDNEKVKREDSDIQFLYNSYHYNYGVRKKGAELYEFEVPSNYIAAVKEIQHSMKYFILEKGIGIETNPSSNYLIGNFKRYDNHPIIDFYNLGLTADADKINKCPQLFVSINTDDQGIFDTYIENEYALMALALEKAVDENGKKIYNQSMIYDWINRIRHMGIEQSFNYNL